MAIGSQIIASQRVGDYIHGLKMRDLSGRSCTNIRLKIVREVMCDSCEGINGITKLWFNLIVYEDKNIEINDLKDFARRYKWANFGIQQQCFPFCLYYITKIVLPETLNISGKCSCKINIFNKLSPALVPIIIPGVIFRVIPKVKRKEKELNISDKPLVVQMTYRDETKEKMVVGIRGYYSVSETIAQGYAHRQNKFIPNDITKLIARHFLITRLRWKFYESDPR